MRNRLAAAALASGLVGLCFYAFWFPITCTDIWWHLAAARRMVEEGRLLHADPFAEDVLGRSWTNLHWVFQLVVYAAHRAGGPLGVVLLKATVGAAAGYLLLRAAEEESTVDSRPSTVGEERVAVRALGVVVLALPIYLSRFLVLERPVVFTLLFLGLFVLGLERFARAGVRRWLWLLVGVQVLWVNTQGGLALLGPAVVGAYLAGGLLGRALARRRRAIPDGVDLKALALCLGAVLLATLLNPYGPRGLLLPLKLLGRIDAVGSEVFSLNVSENIPPFLLERSQAGAVWHFKWVAAAAFASFLLARLSGLVLARLLLLAGFFLLALKAGRNVLLLEWVAGLVVVTNLTPRLRAALARLGPALAAAAAVLAILGALRWQAGRGEGGAGTPAPFRVPAQSVRLLERLDLKGRLFNSVRYGGYLIWALARHRPSIDGRLALRSAAEFGEHLALLDRPDGFEAFRRARGIRIALLPTAYPDRYLPLVGTLYRDPRWRLLYTDGTEALFAFDAAQPRVDLGSRETVSSILRELGRRHPGSPAARELALLHLGRLLVEVGELERAHEVLAPIGSHAARGLLAHVLYLDGRRREARELAGALLRERPHDVRALDLLALIALDEGKHREALELARRALEADPYDLRARRILERLKREARPR